MGYNYNNLPGPGDFDPPDDYYGEADTRVSTCPECGWVGDADCDIIINSADRYHQDVTYHFFCDNCNKEVEENEYEEWLPDLDD
jgi:hypothetical protein